MLELLRTRLGQTARAARVPICRRSILSRSRVEAVAEAQVGGVGPEERTRDLTPAFYPGLVHVRLVEIEWYLLGQLALVACLALDPLHHLLCFRVSSLFQHAFSQPSGQQDP